jgi:hypothetical protein
MQQPTLTSVDFRKSKLKDLIHGEHSVPDSIKHELKKLCEDSTQTELEKAKTSAVEQFVELYPGYNTEAVQFERTLNEYLYLSAISEEEKHFSQPFIASLNPKDFAEANARVATKYGPVTCAWAPCWSCVGGKMCVVCREKYLGTDFRTCYGCVRSYSSACDVCREKILKNSAEVAQYSNEDGVGPI